MHTCNYMFRKPLESLSKALSLCFLLERRRFRVAGGRRLPGGSCQAGALSFSVQRLKVCILKLFLKGNAWKKR